MKLSGVFGTENLNSATKTEALSHVLRWLPFPDLDPPAKLSARAGAQPQGVAPPTTAPRRRRRRRSLRALIGSLVSLSLPRVSLLLAPEKSSPLFWISIILLLILPLLRLLIPLPLTIPMLVMISIQCIRTFVTVILFYLNY